MVQALFNHSITTPPIENTTKVTIPTPILPPSLVHSPRVKFIQHTVDCIRAHAHTHP